jgi:hypothetical protein
MPANVMEDSFSVSSDWLIDGILWTPSVLLGLPANIIVILLSGRETQTLGNFRLAIGALSIVNSLHCLARAIILLFYFSHYFIAWKTTLISCTLISNFFYKWLGFYIAFFIPLLSGYRFVLLCLKNGEKCLTKTNLSIAIAVIVTLPTAIIFGRFFELLHVMKIDTDAICSFKHSDRGCIWCVNFVTYTSYCLYALSLIFSTFLFVHLWRSFRKVGSHEFSSRRLSDEIAILACIIIQSVIPIILTLPTNESQFLRSIGFDRVGMAFAGTLYNYNPLFDALLTVAFVKPYRRAVLRWTHVRRWRESVIMISGDRAMPGSLNIAVVTRMAGLAVVQQNRRQRDTVEEIPSVCT